MTIFDHCAGLDVHRDTIVACVLVSEPKKKKPRKEIRTFRTVRRELEQLRDWLRDHGVTTVAMESTGVYWRPIYEILETTCELFVVNPWHFHNVPGRKTDVIDAEWLATLLRMGLLRKSFVLSKQFRPIRDLARFRRGLIEAETRDKNQILKLLEGVGVKLATFISDVFGKSGLSMLHAIVDGKLSASEIANMALGRLKKKRGELELALETLLEPHHRMMLGDLLERLEQTRAKIAHYDGELEKLVAPYQATIKALCSIDGVQPKAAIALFAETGSNLADFPTDGKFAAWSGTCPGSNQSGGKNRRAPRRRGNPHVQSTLFQIALVSTRMKKTYLYTKYHRLKARRGAMRALMAVAHKLARAVYRVLTTGERYVDLGPDYLDRKRPELIRQLAAKLKRLATPKEILDHLGFAELLKHLGLATPDQLLEHLGVPLPTPASEGGS